MRKDRIEKVIAALISNPTTKQAAKALGVNESTLYNYLREDDFQKAYQEARRNLVERSTHYIQAKVSAAAEAVAKIMDNVQNAPQVRLNAAQIILSYSVKMTEQADIIERIDALEAELQDN